MFRTPQDKESLYKTQLTFIPQQFRPGGRSNRSGRSQADHDVFEGLPVRQWQQGETIVGLPPPAEVIQDGENAWPELPLPRDSSQLAPWTQQLLREARRPRLAKRPQEPTEDDKQEDEEESETVQTGWLSKKWSQVPSHLEKPEREFLAKRRKGLPSLHTQMALQAANAAASSAPTRKTKVMKADANGNTTVYEVLVPEGQTVEGEVADDTVMADAAPMQAAPGTVIEGVGIANAEGVIVATDLLQQQQPQRRKPIPPRRIRKGGPGRGKKKVMFNAEEGHYTAIPSTPGGAANTATSSAGNDNTDGSAMDIDSTPKPEDNDDGDDDEGDDGEEGDDDDDREEGEVSDAEEAQPAEQQTTSKTEEAAPEPPQPEAEVKAEVSVTEEPPVSEAKVEEPDTVTEEPEKPEVPAAQEATPATAPQPEAPIASETEVPAKQEPEAPAIEETEAPTTQEPEPPIVQEVKASPVPEAEAEAEAPIEAPVEAPIEATVEAPAVDIEMSNTAQEPTAPESAQAPAPAPEQEDTTGGSEQSDKEAVES